jgi:hypothetical protein
MPKTPKEKAPQGQPTTESLLDDVVQTLGEGLSELRKQIRLIASGKAKSNGHDAGSRIAFLTVKAGAIADSIRKVESARAKRVAGLTPALVMAWFRTLEPSEQHQFVASLSGDGQKKGIFG